MKAIVAMVILLAFLVLCSCDNRQENKSVITAGIMEPPKPDFKNKINYMQWANELILSTDCAFANGDLIDEWREAMDDKFPGWDVIRQLRKYAEGEKWSKREDSEVAKWIELWQGNISIFRNTIKQDNFPVIGFVSGEGFYDLDTDNLLFFSEFTFPHLSDMNWFAYIILADINAVDNYSNSAKKLDAWRDVLEYCYSLEQSNISRAIKDSYKLRPVIYKSIKDSISNNILQKDDLDSVENMLMNYPVGPSNFSLILASEWAMDYCFLQSVYNRWGRINKKVVNSIAFLDGRDLGQELCADELKPKEIADYVEEYYLQWQTIIDEPDFGVGSVYVSLRPELASHPLNGILYARFDLLLRDNQLQNEEYVAILEFIDNEKE